MTKEQLKRTKIEKLEVSQRCYNALYRKGYRIIGDLIGKTPEQLKRIRNIGEKTFNELTEKLDSIGFMIDDNGSYVIDTNKLIQENLKDLTSETYMGTLEDALKELVSNTKKIENIDKQVLSLQLEKTSIESKNASLVNTIHNIYIELKENTQRDNDILQNNKGKKYVIK